MRNGHDDTQKLSQRYVCRDCQIRFDDLSDTVLAGHRQPLKVWILCLYFMGLSLSNRQVAQELSLNESDVQEMTTHLRQGLATKPPDAFCRAKSRSMRSVWSPATREIPPPSKKTAPRAA